MSNKLIGNQNAAKPHVFAPRPFRSASPDISKRCRKLLKHFGSDVFDILEKIKTSNPILYVQLYLKIIEITAKNDDMLYNRELEKIKLLMSNNNDSSGEDVYTIEIDSEGSTDEENDAE